MNNNIVLEFVQKRFKNDCNWIDGNCYYFAVILNARFPEGNIYYDVIYGHFIFMYHGKFYDWNGIVNKYGCLISWDKFDEYDSLLQDRIIRDCIL